MSGTDWVRSLVAAIIMQAVKDYQAGETGRRENERNRRSAERFLRSRKLDEYCEIIDTDANTIRTKLGIKNKTTIT